VLIFDRDRPVARLEPVSRKDIPDDERLQELLRRGIVTAPRGRLDVKAFLEMQGLPAGVDAVRAVLEEREESPW